MKFKHLLFISLLFFTASCGLFQKAQAPKADATAKIMTASLNSEVLSFYNNLAAASNKSYTGHQTEYSNISNDIRSLAVYDSARKHSDALLIIVHELEKRFHDYEGEHKGYGNLNTAQVNAYKNGMDGILDVLIRTENHYK